MIFTFNLIDENWIPCITSEGDFEEISLRRLFAEAHEIREISCETPIQSAAMMPLLLAILHRNFGPASAREWGELWQAGKFNMENLDAYFAEWYERFDLFHPERPFYQVVDDRVKTAAIYSHLAQTMQNHSVHFTHQTENNVEPLCAAEAARVLLQAQAFRLGGGISGKETPNHVDSIWSRGVVFFARGDNLFETLALNLVRYPDNSVMPTTERDRPAWERDDPTEGRSIGKKMLKLSPAGYLDYLTWQTNHIQLIPLETNDGLRVKETRIAPVAQFHDHVYCPQNCYLRRTQKDKEDEFVILRFDINKALWRNYHGMLPQNDDDKLPNVIRWWSRLIEWGHLPENRRLQLVASGLMANKAKTIFFRQEIMPLPLYVLQDREQMNDITNAIDRAEKIARILSGALHLLADRVMNKTLGDSFPSKDKNSRDARQKLMSQWNAAEAKRYSPQLYWTRLEREFEVFVNGLRDDSDEAMTTWNKTLVKTAEEALKDAVRLAGDSPWALKGSINAERYLRRQLNELLNE